MASGDVLTFPATRPGFSDAFGRFRRALDGRALSPGARYRSELTFEEIVANIVRHGDHGPGEHEIVVTIDTTPDGVVLVFEDDGICFNPSLHHPPSGRPTSLAETQSGGRGLWLVRVAAKSVEYERTPQDRNRVTVTIAAD